MTPDEQLAVVRLVTWWLEALVAVVTVHYRIMLVRHPDFRMSVNDRLATVDGVAMQALGWMLHQSYWWVWQVAIVRGDNDLKALLEVAAWVTMAAYTLVWIGASLMLSPHARRVSGAWWPATTAAVLAALLCLAFLVRR